MKKFLSDSILITAGGLVNRTKGFIFIPIIVAHIGLEGYGAYTQIMIIVLTLKAVFSLELGSGFQRFVPGLTGDRHHHANHFFSVFFPTILMGIVGAFLVFLMAGWLNEIFLENSYLLALQYASLVLLTNVCYANFSKYFLAVKKFKTYTTVTFFYDLLPYLAFVGGIIYSKDVAFGMLLYLLLDTFIVVILVFLIMVSIPFKNFSMRLFRQYIGYSYALSLGSIEGGLLDKVDRYFISYFMGVESVGIYNVIYKICSVSSFITTPIKKQLLSYLAGVWDKGYHEAAVMAVRQGLLIFGMISIGLMAFLSINMQSILDLLLDDEIPAIPLGWIVVFIGSGIIAEAAKRFYNLLIHLEKKTVYELRYQTAGLLLNVLFNLILIPFIGLLGAAIATFISYVLVIGLIELRYRLALDKEFGWHILTFVFIAASVCYAFNLLFGQWYPLGLLFSAIASSTAYLALVYYTKQEMLIDLKQKLIDFKKLV